jgi:hypothetical protein
VDRDKPLLLQLFIRPRGSPNSKWDNTVYTRLHEIRDKLALPSRPISNDLRCVFYNIFLRSYMHHLFILHAEFSWHALDIVGLLWGAEKRLKLGPALQQAEAPLSKPRRTLI